MRVVPRATTTDDAADACELAAGYGLTPDDWQEDILEGWLGRRRNGRWSSATCGLAVPRQNGKNAVIEVRELFGMVLLGEKFLHTAHEVKTARKAFLRIASFFENARKYPELAALKREIRKTNGQEAILLTNGGSIEFIARSKGSGRGFTVDVLVCDEAQDLTDEELAALLPTISAAPQANPQVILTGTPPDPDKNQMGEVFRRVRADGEGKRDPRLCWIDFGVKDGPIPDVDDEALWYEVNPTLGGRLNVAEVERERKLMSPEVFARERLGWWGDPAGSLASAFPRGAWAACRDDRIDTRTGLAVSQIEGIPELALDVSPDRSRASLAVAGRREDGLTHVEVVDHDRDRPGVVMPGTSWVLGRARQIIESSRARGVILDPGSAAGALIPALREAGIHVVEVGGRDYTQACGAMYDAVADGKLRHLGQPDLDSAVNAAKAKPVGDAWKWDRRDGLADITPLVAVTLALSAVSDAAPVSFFFFNNLDDDDEGEE